MVTPAPSPRGTVGEENRKREQNRIKAVLHPAVEALVIIRGKVPGGAMGMQDLTYWVKVNEEGLAVARGPYESVTISTSRDQDPRIAAAPGADIAYCAMLYGKTHAVRKHATGAMLQGWQLRRDAAPIIRETVDGQKDRTP